MRGSEGHAWDVWRETRDQDRVRSYLKTRTPELLHKLARDADTFARFVEEVQHELVTEERLFSIKDHNDAVQVAANALLLRWHQSVLNIMDRWDVTYRELVEEIARRRETAE